MSKTKEETLQAVEDSEELSPLYYFYSVGCGWCKKSEPIVDELIKEGHDILKLDLSDPENKKINEELKKEFNTQCGTPWLINADTGHQICGFREKDIMMKWIEGEDIPQPPKPKGPPPPPPQDFDNEGQVKEWKEKYEAWKEENKHMPNLPESNQMLQRLQQQKKMMEQKQAQQAPQNGVDDVRLTNLEIKLDALIKHLGVRIDPAKLTKPKQPVIPQKQNFKPPPPSNKPPKVKKGKK